ncbi:hypothetical protein ACEWY4_001267 [Coilia grayii]|uniref:Uncharacterized protein n=1 Tax=Coilia grayii TaxID=363190 RepID=A0ABD1KZ25_9TELE
MPKAKPHQTVLSEQPLPVAPALPSSLPPPDRLQVQYEQSHHVAGKRRGEKRRLDFEEPQPGLSKRPIQLMPAAATFYVPPAVSAALVLLVVPAQPQAPSIYSSWVFVPVLPPRAPTMKPILLKKSDKHNGAC